MSDAQELAAWRYLAAHRVGALRVTHVQFIHEPEGDGGPCRMNTPSIGAFYEDVRAGSWGGAAIKLALALGMPHA